MDTLLQPGDRCAGHEIVRLLGRGGHAAVYEARLIATGEPRAFKHVTVDGPAAAELHARLRQEGEAILKIRHPNIVRLFGGGLWQNRVFLSLEMIEGVTLGERLGAEGKPGPLRDVLFWMQQACAGLAAAHEQGVVHRDVTPSNILIQPGNHVKVIDFGLAHVADVGLDATIDHRNGSAMFMSPERANGAPADPLMDVYSMGLLLYWALAGVPAVRPRSRSVTGILEWQREGVPAPLCRVAPWVPGDVGDVVDQSLAKDPAERPEGMAVLAEVMASTLVRMEWELRRVLANLPLGDRGPLLAATAPARDGPAPPIGDRGTIVMAAPPQPPPPIADRRTSPMAARPRPPLPIDDRGAASTAARPRPPPPIDDRGTIPMAARREPPPSGDRAKIPTVVVPQPPAPAGDGDGDRVAWLPVVVPTLMSAVSPAPPSEAPPQPPPSLPPPLPPSLPPSSRQPAFMEPHVSLPAFAGLRSTDEPVESSARGSISTRRRVPLKVAAVGGLAFAAAGWMLIVRMSGPASEPRPRSAVDPPPSVSAPLPAQDHGAPVVPAVSASATAAPAVSASATAVPPEPAASGAPARRVSAPRSQYTPPFEVPPAKNRLFGADR